MRQTPKYDSSAIETCCCDRGQIYSSFKFYYSFDEDTHSQITLPDTEEFRDSQFRMKLLSAFLETQFSKVCKGESIFIFEDVILSYQKAES